MFCLGKCLQDFTSFLRFTCALDIWRTHPQDLQLSTGTPASSRTSWPAGAWDRSHRGGPPGPSLKPFRFHPVSVQRCCWDLERIFFLDRLLYWLHDTLSISHVLQWLQGCHAFNVHNINFDAFLHVIKTDRLPQWTTSLSSCSAWTCVDILDLQILIRVPMSGWVEMSRKLAGVPLKA